MNRPGEVKSRPLGYSHILFSMPFGGKKQKNLNSSISQRTTLAGCQKTWQNLETSDSVTLLDNWFLALPVKSGRTSSFYKGPNKTFFTALHLNQHRLILIHCYACKAAVKNLQLHRKCFFVVVVFRIQSVSNPENVWEPDRSNKTDFFGPKSAIMQRWKREREGMTLPALNTELSGGPQTSLTYTCSD